MANLELSQTGIIPSQLLTKRGIHGFYSLRDFNISATTRMDQNFGLQLGDSDKKVAANLNRLMQSTGLNSLPHQVIQTHQTNSLWCNGEGYMHDHEADILLSDQAGTALAIRTADCLPILLAEPKSGLTAAIHAGWRGTASKVTKQAIQSMLQRGAKAENILASLGPCIGSCCFNIGEDTALALKQSAKNASKFIGNSADLRQINRLQLLECGLIDHHIECINACTACDSKRFFSFRRDAGVTGRHLAVVAIASKP